jgi:periplasmic divalent cation tolerance protein
MSFIQVTTTTGTKELAQTIARRLVEEKLAACVQITGGIESVYQWKGKVESAHEYLCLIKTRAALFDRVTRVIRELHSYETPEIIAVGLATASDDYLKWLEESLADTGE